MADLGPNGQYILLPVDIPVPNVAQESFIAGRCRRVRSFSDGTGFSGIVTGPSRGINPGAAHGIDGLGLGEGPAGRRNDIGTTFAPSQLLNTPLFRILTLIPVNPGVATIAIKVRYWPDTPDDRPSFLIRRNLDVGILEDVETIAPAGGELVFVTIDVTVVAASIGVLECYRKGRSQRHDAYTFWDALSLTQ